jgi:hypothetical protein
MRRAYYTGLQNDCWLFDWLLSEDLFISQEIVFYHPTPRVSSLATFSLSYPFLGRWSLLSLEKHQAKEVGAVCVFWLQFNISGLQRFLFTWPKGSIDFLHKEAGQVCVAIALRGGTTGHYSQELCETSHIKNWVGVLFSNPRLSSKLTILSRAFRVLSST